MKRFYRQLSADILTAVVIFGISMAFHGGVLKEEIRTFGIPALCYYGFHIFISLAYRKYEYDQKYSYKKLTRLYIHSWLVSSLMALLIIVIFRFYDLSRQVIMINLFGLVVGEYLLILGIHLFRSSVSLPEPEEIMTMEERELVILYPPVNGEKVMHNGKTGWPDFRKTVNGAYDFASAWFELTSPACQILETANESVILSFPVEKYNQIINFHKINHIPNINKFLGAINSRLPIGGLLMICAETNAQRKARLLQKYPPLINRFYLAGDYIFTRLFPELPVGKNIFQALTKKKSILLSRPEILGRMIATGFEIVAEKDTKICHPVIGRKVRLPYQFEYATYGPLIHLNRVGKSGKIVKIYKLRTMYPYSEFIQEFVYDRNKLAVGGKISDDFRITPAGRWLRRYWIDELPGLWNWIRGDVKLVGVRPLSKHYFGLYDSDLQQKRIQFKPGLVPPFYADLPGSLDEIMASERRYLEQYEKAPLRTDTRYLFKAAYNIIFKGAKSQ